MRNLQIVRKYNVKPAYKSPLCFCAGDQSSLIVIDNNSNNDDTNGSSNGQGTRILRIFPGKTDIQQLHQFSEQELEMLHPDVDKPNAIQISYSRPNDTIYIATQAGGFYQFPIGSEEIEEMLIAPTGISTFAVSPDSRYLVIGTTDETIILFSLPDLEMLATIELPQNQKGEVENEQQVGIDISICWRHDSRYFAVNYIFQGIRKLQVYDENGTLYSTTEDCNPIPIHSKCLAWQPSGGLIGTLGISPALNNSENITFFELNGLKRFDFHPFEGRMDSRDKSRVLDIHWNVNSDVLALRKENTVELWVRANYVWMCKKTIHYEENEDETENISFVAWDTELPYRLHTVFSNGEYYVRDLAFVYSTGLSAGSALTVSINGPQLYCTPFRDTCAPPPTCRFQVNVGSSLIQEIVTSNFWDGFFAVLSSGELVFFKYSKKNNSLVKVATAQILTSDEKEGKTINVKTYYNWIWLNKTQISCLSTNGNLLTFELSNTDFLLQESNDEGENSKESEVVNVNLKLSSSLSVRGKLLLPIFNDNIQKSSGSVKNDDDLQEKVETKFLLVQKRCGAILLQEVGIMPNILLGRLPDSVHELKYILLNNEPQEEEEEGQGKESNVINKEYKVSENSVVVLGLDPLTRTLHALYKNTSLKLMSDITSMEIFNGIYLLATTTQGSLEVIHVKDLLQFLQSSGEKNQQQQQNSIILEKINVPLSTPSSQVNQLNSYSRKVEKGSIIINCCWNRILEPALTLQILPRGNLEIISPRPLIISSMALLLQRRKYNQVMIAMRRHRLDFNVLAQQLKDLSKTNNNNTTTENDLLLKNHLCSILDDVQDSHTLVLMVTELGVEHLDVVKLMKGILEDKLFNNNTSSSSSNDTKDKDKGLVQPYLAVMAKLNLYEKILCSPLISGSEATTDREIIKGRIKFLSFYCDNPEILYESALGTYDLGLTSLVADCLNKDPKEYLPILTEYKSYSEPKLKFTIDNKLKRYSKAIVSLLRQQEYEQEQQKESTIKNIEIIKYIQRHRIYQAGIKYLEEKKTTTNDNENDSILLKQIYSSYGSYFEELRKLPEAAISYNRAQDYDRCFECYAKSGNWVQAIIIINQIQQNNLDDKEKIPQLYLQLVNHLDDLKDFEAAAQVLDYHLQNKKEAFRYYVKAHNWGKANLMIEFLKNDKEQDSSKELLNKYERELRDGVNNLEENCNSTQEEIHRYTQRLSIIRKEKEDREANGGGFDQDNFSDTESISTVSSIRSSSHSVTSSTMHSEKSYRSRKSVRKEKKKLLSLKEGSRFEDIAIIVHLWELISRRVKDEIKPQVEAILPSLWAQRIDDEARKLITDFEALLQEADQCIKEVWSTILPQQEKLEFKYCVPPPEFSTLWSKVIL